MTLPPAPYHPWPLDLFLAALAVTVVAGFVVGLAIAILSRNDR